jgi:hypothetical protein
VRNEAGLFPVALVCPRIIARPIQGDQMILRKRIAQNEAQINFSKINS